MGGNVYFARMFRILQQPYPLNESRANRQRRNVLFGLFVSLFLWLFQPFGIAGLPHFELHALGYGLVTSASMFAVTAMLMALFPQLFREKHWTTGKEIAVTMLHIAFIGGANALYTTWALGGGWSLGRLLFFELVTIGVGIFPVAGSYMVNQWILEKRYREGALALNADLKEVQPNNANPASSELLIKGDNQDEVVQLHWNELLLVQAAENYMELVYESAGKVHTQLLRKSMKQLEVDLAPYPALLRCHKSYVVNLQRVVRTSGNAQGYRLHLDAGGHEVPVSRSLNAALPNLLHQYGRHGAKV
ncbi:MAG: LytTR family transcriptional regulator [Sphingobacteriaceae bacterium]|nr:LytTR family transcriptional regulator [Sphingobacteriaceae bacterium]